MTNSRTGRGGLAAPAESPDNRQTGITGNSPAGRQSSSGPVGRIESGGYMTTSITQLLPEDRLFQSGTTNAPLLRADPDYIGGVKADILTYRAPATPQGGTGTSLCRGEGRPEHTADPAAQQPRSAGTG